MLKSVTINSKIVNNYLITKDYSSLAVYLKETFRLERTENGAPLQFDFSSDILNVLQEILLKLTKEEINADHKDILKETFRSLRNYVINPSVQNYLSGDDEFLKHIKTLVHILSSLMSDVLQIILQFLINLVISNKVAALKVYSIYANEILYLLKNSIHPREASALLYNISLYRELILDFEQYVCILQLYEGNPDIEFLHFLLEKFITSVSFWSYFTNFDINKRLIIIEIIQDKHDKGEQIMLPECCVKTLINFFVNSSSIIFQTISCSESNLEPYEVARLLQVISSLTSKEEYLKILQNDKDLLINIGVLLINIHRLGKESINYFSSIQSLAELRGPNKTIAQHPAFGFKADLIRIIGNICWKNRTMQDLAREAELVPVILDCCNIDARNPFIMQWVILAIRNLCEANVENQTIIAELHQQGTVSTSVLEEMGLTLHSDEEMSLKVVPLEVLQNQK